MKLRILALTSVILGLALVAVTQEQEPAAAPAKTPATAAPAATPAKTNAAPVTSTAATKPAASEQYIVIGFLERQDGTVITIKSGPSGPAYTVASKDGKVLHENLTSEQLRAKAPEIHDFLKSAVADSPKKPVKDSRLLEGRL